MTALALCTLLSGCEKEEAVDANARRVEVVFSPGGVGDQGYNDNILAGLQQAGRKVPEDISIVGFDDILWSRMTNPMLTTIHQDADEKGRLAARCMIGLLEGTEPEKSQIILPVRLIERDSVRDISDSDKLL